MGDRVGEEPLVVGGRYVLGKKLGAGGMGVVHEADDQVLGRTVALKLLLPSQETDPTAFPRLEREARAAARLGHPNIVRVLDFGRHGQGGFLVMEQLGGETLDTRIAREGALSVDAAARIHLQLLDALGAAHAEGILHRDVKPSNVFLTRLADGSELVKLLDFGLAYLFEAEGSKKLTATGIAIGTPAYMAPERIRGAPVDERSDLYSAGVSLYEALTGELPFDADTPIALRGRILLEEAPSLSTRRPEIAEALAEVVACALAKSPSERFASASAMADALRAALGGTRPKATHAIALGETLPAMDVASSAVTIEATRSVPATAAPVAQLAPTSRTGPLRAPPRARPRWLLGLGAGVACGVLALVVLGALHLTRDPIPTPAPATATAPPPPPAEVAPAPPVDRPADVAETAEAPEELAVEAASAPTPEPPAIDRERRRPPRTSRPRPPRATPAPDPAPDPEPSLDVPLRPRFGG